MNLLDKIRANLNEALKAKDELKTSALRFLLSKLHNAKIAKGDDLADEEIVEEIAKEVKRHRESIEAFEAGQRSDLVEKEQKELAILEEYLPTPLTDAQIEKMVEEAMVAVDAKTIADLGKVIKAVIGSAGARAQGAKVAEIARRKLGS